MSCFARFSVIYTATLSLTMRIQIFSAIIGTLLLASCTAANPGDQNSSTISSLGSLNPMITVATPQPNQVVTSPLTVTGEARGPWYFEASFPVKLVDAQGNLIVQHYAQAQGEWMTGDLVPFSSTLTFTTTAKTGFLILEKDNPSGLPENADEIQIPVKFE